MGDKQENLDTLRRNQKDDSQHTKESESNKDPISEETSKNDWYVPMQKTIFDNTTSPFLLKIKSWMNATCNSDHTKSADKLYHNFNVFMIFLGVYLLGTTPGSYFIHWAVIYQIILYLKRIILYLQYGYQFFFDDFCYITFVYQLVFIYIYPGERWIYMSCIGASGLSMIIFVFNYGVVFHDWEKTHGIVQHIFLTIMMWQIHWNLRGTPEREQWGFYDPELIEFSFGTIIEYYKNFYIYYFWIFIPIFYGVFFIFYKKVRAGYVFYMYDVMFANKFIKEGYTTTDLILGCVRCGIIHFRMFTFFATIMWACMYSYYVFNIFISFIVFDSFNRGANYYIYYFPTKYSKNLKALDKYGPEHDYLDFRRAYNPVKKQD